MKVSALGFTLIELLIVIAIIGILSAISIPSFSSFNTNQRLSQAAKQVKNDLRSAQNRALNNIDGKAWRISFSDPNAQSYTSRKCDLIVDDAAGTCAFTSCSDVDVKSFATSFSFLVAESVGFEQATGRVCVGTALLSALSTTITLDLDGATRTITVSAGGKIEEQKQ